MIAILALPCSCLLFAYFFLSFTLASRFDRRSIERLEQKTTKNDGCENDGVKEGKGNKHHNKKHLAHSYLQEYPHVTTTTTFSPRHENSSGAKEKKMMFMD